MKTPIFQVDAFTHQPFRGNPAAVCILDSPRPDAWMLAVAQEMNLSETAFLLPEEGMYRLRWFTPAVEEKLCGHATLASAHVLWESGKLKPDETARFNTLSGVLTASKYGSLIELNFPATPPEPVETPPLLLDALKVSPLYVGKSPFDYLVEVADDETVRNLQPNMTLMREMDIRGIIITSRSKDPKYDFISRFFAPHDGIDEDPVTGSAHCCLGPYWREKLGKTSFNAYQASRRGGMIAVRLEGNRTILGGEAVTVMGGELYC